MNFMLISMMIITTICFMMTLLITLINKKCINDMQKATPFECGFNPMSYPRLPFSIHFFSIAVMFLIFDIEIVLILPMILSMKTSMIKFWMMTSTMFIMILMVGLMHEWKNGMINWTN